MTCGATASIQFAVRSTAAHRPATPLAANPFAEVRIGSQGFKHVRPDQEVMMRVVKTALGVAILGSLPFGATAPAGAPSRRSSR